MAQRALIWLLLLLCIVPSESQAIFKGLGLRRPRVDMTDPMAKNATCAFNIVGLMVGAAKIGTAAATVERACFVQQTSLQISRCATTVQNVLFSSAFFLGSVVSALDSCSRTLIPAARCTSQRDRVIAVLSILGSSVANLESSCRVVASQNSVDWVPPAVRRLSPDRVNQPIPLESNRTLAQLPAPPGRMLNDDLLQKIRNKLAANAERDERRASCAVDALLTFTLTAQDIVATVGVGNYTPCDEEDVGSDRLGPSAACVVQLTGIISTFEYVGSLIALLFAECPAMVDFRAACASDALAVIGAVTNLVQQAPGLLLLCEELSQKKALKVHSKLVRAIIPALII
ncbi:unnamed protein product [Effrenium voratum]|uniref:Uncharacterized protein n=1 Tax=Effrenium voratum TaxID=2562239 RepID=A0AA36HV84_9DINO|nr:unnamed protein product [Effrenium voratum]